MHPLLPLAPTVVDRGSVGLGTELPSSQHLFPTLPLPSLWVQLLLAPRPGRLQHPLAWKGTEDVSHVVCEGESSLRIEEVGEKGLGASRRGACIPASHTLPPPWFENFVRN